MITPEDEKVVNQALHQLGEHWPDVQILLSRTIEMGTTERYYTGAGNWFARKGMMHNALEVDAAGRIAEQFNG